MTGARPHRRPAPETALFVSLWVLEVSALAVILALLKNGGRLAGLSYPNRPVSRLFLGGALGFLLATTLAVLSARRSFGVSPRLLGFTLALNGLSVAALLIIAELTIRFLSVSTPQGRAFMGTVLHPKSWESVVARNRLLLDSAPNSISYFVADPLLGWAIGPARQSKDGMYASSVEGIRSKVPGVRYSDRRPRHRIAIVGDSYTFGLEVPFEDTWGSRLERLLGPDWQILNFGVDGYGVDQAWLRYKRDVRPLHPDLVIFGFIKHDLHRTLAVYAFVSFPEWGFPFAKPRFILEGEGRLRLLNVPLPTPQAILEARSIADLPFIEYDLEYVAADWCGGPQYGSYVARFLRGRFHPEPEMRPRVADEALVAVNQEILMTFARTAAGEGSTPLIVFLPSRAIFKPPPVGEVIRPPAKDAILASLRARNHDARDLTPCLARLPPERLFIPNRPHYTVEGNAALAVCMEPILLEWASDRAGQGDEKPGIRHFD